MRRFSRFRSAILIVLVLAVTGQPFASAACQCDEHGSDDAPVAAHADGHEHGQMHADGHEYGQVHADGSHADWSTNPDSGVQDMAAHGDCSSSGASCQCGACGQFFGMIVHDTDAVSSNPLLTQVLPRHYLEPPQRQAFRPPIHA
jgi:hypothetical protein